jgi:hypothetical protein
MLPAEASEQIHLNLRSIRANDKLIKLLDSRDADGGESYCTKHLTAVGVTVLGDYADAVVDLPGWPLSLLPLIDTSRRAVGKINRSDLSYY